MGSDITSARVRELDLLYLLSDREEEAREILADMREAMCSEPARNRIAAALDLLERVERQDAGLVEAIAKTIHDTDGMADTVWPDSEDDNGYRGGGAYVRLCRDPEVFRNAARAALAALVGEK